MLRVSLFGMIAALVFASQSSAVAEEGFFLAIGGMNGKADDGHTLEGQFGTIYTSRDGKQWTSVFKGGPVKEKFSHANNNLLRCATYGNGLFVVTGNPHCVFISKDEKNWETVETPTGAFSVEFGNGMFLAPNASHFMTSRDGRHWTQTKQPADFPIWGPDGAGHIRKVVFGNGVFVCVGEQRLGVTPDGVTWKHHEILAPDKRPGKNVLLFGNKRFVWLCENTGPQTSTDGIHWEPITTFGELSEKSAFGDSGVFDGKKFLTSPSHWSDENKVIFSSDDGLNWKRAVERAAGSRFAAAGNGLLLQNQGWSNSFTISADGGKTWEQIKANIPSRQVYFFDGTRIIGQSGG